MECPFCQIVSGQREASVVLRTPRFVVFEPITQAPNKFLVVPSRHVERLSEMSLTDLGEWARMPQDLSDRVHASSYKIQINVGGVNQNVRHLYMQFSYSTK